MVEEGMWLDQKWFVTDLDGTLLRSDATVSPYSIDIWTKAAHQGYAIAYATARSYVSSWRIVADIPWNAPLIVYNGAMILEPVSKKVLACRLLSAELSNTILEYGLKQGLKPFLFILDENKEERVLHEKLDRSGNVQFHASRPGDRRFQEVERLQCSGGSGTLSVTYIGVYEELAPFYQFIIDQLGASVHAHMMADRYIHGHYFLEFSHPMANKRNGLQSWCELVGADPQHVTVFGDQLNDVGLFELAGHKLAVNNAHESIKELADSIILSNDDDGVARYMEGHLTSRLIK
jgi:Cof subfamily protein (haloacid dehalogenase superfamily)